MAISRQIFKTQLQFPDDIDYTGRDGELVVDLNTLILYVHDGVTPGGFAISGGGGNGIPGGANGTIQFNTGGMFGGNTNLYWDGANLNATSILVNNLTSNGIVVNGNAQVTALQTNNLQYANGQPWVFAGTNYSNANVAAYLPTYSGNITGGYYLGNVALALGLPTQYSNANVASYLPTYTGALTSLTGNVVTTANISGSYILGNGAFLTGITSGGSNYSNANVASYLPTYSGNLALSSDIIALYANAAIQANLIANNTSNITINTNNIANNTANITSNTANIANLQSALANTNSNVTNNTSNITLNTNNIANNTANIANLQAAQYTNANVQTYLPTYSGNITGGYYLGNVALALGLPVFNYSNANVANFLLTNTGNVSANYFLGNITLATGYSILVNAIANLTSLEYSNANVAAYLPTYTGNLTNSSDIITLYANASAQANAIANLQNAQYSNANVAAYLPTYAGNLFNVNNITAENILSIGNVDANVGTFNYSTVDFGLNVGTSTPANIIATGNITGQYFLGNGAYLTGLPATYSNTNVAAYLPTYSGNLAGGNAIITNTVYANLFVGNFQGNITGNLVVPGSNTQVLFNNNGNAGASSGLTFNSATQRLTVAGLTSTANLSANVANINYATFNDDVYIGFGTPANLTVTANVTANNFVGNVANIAGNVTANAVIINSGVGNSFIGSTSNIVLAPTGQVSVLGNIQANYYFGNGAFLTGIATGTNYSNANVASYLPTYTGNITGNNISLTGNVSFVGVDLFTVSSTTSNTNPNQVLYQIAASSTNAADFDVVATDSIGGSRQSVKLNSVTYGGTTSYVQYAGITINTTLGNFVVAQNGGFVQLLVTPTVGNPVNYTIIVKNY